MTWIKEETLFTVLNWLSPVTTGIIITIYMCEGFYISLDDPLLVFYWKVPTYWTFQSNLETFKATKRNTPTRANLPHYPCVLQLLRKNTSIAGEGHGGASHRQDLPGVHRPLQALALSLLEVRETPTAPTSYH